MVQDNKKSLIPHWVGNYPFAAGKKKPVLIDRDKSVLFMYGQEHKVSCTTAISTNYIQSGIMIIPPGEYFEPPDIHSGDEVYYVLNGEGAVLDPETGRAVKIKKGQVILIPKGIWHQAFNTCDENLEVLAFIAPLQWQKGHAEVPSEFTGEAAYYKGSKKQIKGFGKWPDYSEVQNATNEICVIKEENALGVIHGTTKHCLVSFYISNNNLHVGSYTLAAGFSTDMESHQGDEIIYLQEGHLGIETHEKIPTQEATINDIFEIKGGQFFLIPERTTHRYFNLSDQTLKVMFGVAPQL